MNKDKDNFVTDYLNEGDINYVAIGDSFASGFNTKLGFNNNGRLENGKITGLGYPEFFAKLMKDNNFSLTSFENLSIPSASINFIDALVLNKNIDLDKFEANLDLLQSLDWHSKNPSKEFFSHYFKNWNIQRNDFKIFNKKITDANLITITLGFSDLFFNLPYLEILKLNRVSKQDEKDLLVEFIYKKINSLSIKLIQDYKKLVNDIKFINKKAKIIITNYPDLFINLKDIIKKYFDKVLIGNLDLFSYLFLSLDSAINSVAKECNVNYIDIYDEKYWKENSFYLCENIFSICPTEKGYKKVAFDLFTKLSLNKNEFNKNLENDKFTNDYIAAPKYWLSDINKYQSLFKLNINNEKIFSSVYGSNKNLNIFVYSDLETSSNTKIRPYLNISDYLDLFIRYSDNESYNIAQTYIKEKFLDAPENYHSVDLLIGFLNNKKWSREALLTLIKERKFDLILFILQINVKRKVIQDNEIFDLQLLKNEWKGIVSSYQNLIYNVFKQFLNSTIIDESKEEIKKISIAVASDAMNTSFLAYLFGFKNSKKFEKFRQYFATLNSFQKLIDFIVNILINYSDVYKELKNFDELWYTIINKNKYNLMYLFDSTFLEITNEDKIQTTVEFIIQTLNSSIRMQKLNAKDKILLDKSITRILEILRANPKFLNRAFVKFLDNVKNISVYDLIVNRNNQKNIKFRKIISLDSYFILGIQIFKHFIKIKKIIKKNRI